MFPPAASRSHLQIGFRVVLCWLAALPALRAEYLYSTNFESFTVGPDQWIDTQGWIGNSPGDGVHGIDQDLLPTLGKTAYLGFDEPSETFVSVATPLNYNPGAQGAVEVYVESLLGIEDSTNGKHDNFYLSFYNCSGAYLASLLFSNHPSTYGIWRLDGLEQFDTTIDFITGELPLISMNIDHAANTWSAAMDGIPLFTDATFSATARTLDVGPVAYEWQLTGTQPTEFGDNWLLVADLIVIAVPPGEGPFVTDTVGLDESGQPILTFTGEPGWNYQVEYSDDGTVWLKNLPGSFTTGIAETTQIEFTDLTPEAPIGRYYRVVRSVTP